MELVRIYFSDINGVLSFIPATTALASFDKIAKDAKQLSKRLSGQFKLVDYYTT